MIEILLLVVGMAVLIAGAHFLVDGASSFAGNLGVPPIVIGLTIVAFGTSSPELAVNVLASYRGNTALTLGNVLGSNIFNVLAILGVASIIASLRVTRNTTWIEVPLALMAACVAGIMANDHIIDGRGFSEISRIDGIILLFFFIIFLVYNFHLARSESGDDSIQPKKHATAVSMAMIFGGLAMLIGGAHLIVESAMDLARAAGISERVIGLTVVAVGTSLPELAASVAATIKKNVDIAIGNVVGSNIFNVFLILGVSSVINPVTLGPGALSDLFVNILASLLLFLFIFTGKGKRIEWWEGIVMLSLYTAYVTFLVMGIL